MSALRIGIIEPHLRRYGGIRRMVEFSNRLIARGHEATFYLPADQELFCGWMRSDAAVRPITQRCDDELDVVIFNHEPHWYLLDAFPRARRRVFYALHYGRLYGKAGSWESIRAAVDIQLANSNWTADMIEAEIGTRPTVVLGGVNRETFRPHGGAKRYQVLCSGDRRREWKGTDTVLAAGRQIGVHVEEYGHKDLDQTALGYEYDAARVFAVGSWFEGFCQPGLEALACGVPLVTTDNGGCREYAIDEQTALVVPPRDADAMASALARLLADERLAHELSSNGLDLVGREFDWDRRAGELEEVLDGVVAGTSAVPVVPTRTVPEHPTLSVVVLAWDNLDYTSLFVESVRQHTTVPYELIIVDNGSRWDASTYAERAADRSVLNATNLGFARGMNQGLEMARAPYVAFCNNDTVLPEGWAERLLETADAHPNAAIVVPALTAARNAATVRTKPGSTISALDPFSAPPAAVVYLARSDVVRELGGWGEEYEIASGEDVDLCFKVWVNDLDIVFDERVLVDHIGKGSASRLDDWEGLWARNRRRFLEKWAGDDDVPRLADVPIERYARNRAIARAAATWMERYFTTRDQINERVRLFGRSGLLRSRGAEVGRVVWRRVRPHVPPGVARPLGRLGRKLG